MTQEQLTKQQVVDKVKKLLELAKDNKFEHEAAAAMNMARGFMAKFNLNLSDVEQMSYDAAKPHLKTSRVARGWWQPRLASIISKYTNCDYHFYGRGIRFIGMEHEIKICSYTFEMVASQMDTMMRKVRKDLRAQRAEDGDTVQNRRASSTYTRGYATGIMDYLAESLKKQVKEEESRALVISLHPNIVEWNKRLKFKKTNKSNSISSVGKEHGYSDGGKVRVQAGIGNQKRGQVR